MHSDSEAGGLAGYPEQVHPLRLGRLRGLQTRRTGDLMSYVEPYIYFTHLHNLKLSLDFVVVSIAPKRLPQLFYLSCLGHMTLDPVSPKHAWHTLLAASLACSSAALRALDSASVAAVL